jgi:hypothetical protein
VCSSDLAALSFYHAQQAKRDHQSLVSLWEFKSQGARYTFDDGVADRAERERMDQFLQAQIDELIRGCNP